MSASITPSPPQQTEFRNAITQSASGSERVYGKGELTAAEDALLRKVISVVRETELLKRERRELSRAKQEVCIEGAQLRATLMEQVHTLLSNRTKVLAARQAYSATSR